ncbi:MAG: fluoride efflux transporter CrcB [Coriobacteriia bacterium]|nr:fluoride efflux transporter CrcB [Coriobacteriia bacterium]
MARDVIVVALGGAFGAALRFGLGGWIATRTGAGFPWPTFVINIAGAFLIGILMAMSLDRGFVPGNWRLFLGTGVLGGFTTFSTLSYESIALMERGLMAAGFANMFGSGVVGLAAAWLGILIGRSI